MIISLETLTVGTASVSFGVADNNIEQSLATTNIHKSIVARAVQS